MNDIKVQKAEFKANIMNPEVIDNIKLENH